MPSSQTTLCKLLELGWHRTTSDSSGIRCGSPHQVFSCVQSGMVGMSTVTYPMADSTGYHSKRFSGITHWVPAILLTLTAIGTVSTSFLVLSAFANTFVLEKMLMKSVMGYAVAAIAAYAIWFGVSKLMDESKPVAPEHRKFWRVAQWTTTGFLWWTWLSHDMANIAVFLPRVLTVDLMVLISVIFTAGLGFMFYQRGGKIQTIVIEKHSTKYIRSATIIDFCYWIILFIFKEINNIPMSTTWVFVGLLAGRELAIASFTDKRKMKMVFPMVTKDFMKMMVGLLASVGVVVAVHSLQ